MQIKNQNKPAFEEAGNYAKKLETVVDRDTKNTRKKQRSYKR